MEDVLVEEPVLTPIKNGRYNSTSFMQESCLNKFPQFEKLTTPIIKFPKTDHRSKPYSVNL